jgi:hypothetical protein
MQKLFSEAPEFLTGPQNMYFLNSVVATFPEFAFVDKSDQQWTLSDLNVRNYTLPDEGSLALASVSDFQFIKVRAPKTSSVEQLNSEPKALMDLILKGIAIERSLSKTAKYRITSYGDPLEVSEYTDKIGRTWVKSMWLVDFDDTAVLTYILPLPNGPFVIMTIRSSSQLAVYEWDTEAACNLAQVAYWGEFTQWQDFLKRNTKLPPFLSGMSFLWNNDEKHVRVTAANFTINAGKDVFNWLPTSSLYVTPSYYLLNDTVEYGIRKVVLQRDQRGRDYALLYNNVEPDPRLGAKQEESWNDVVGEKYPFDKTPRISEKDNTGTMGAIVYRPSLSNCYSLFFATENPVDTQTLEAHFTAFVQGTTFRK